jgi:Uma2 family endonuclease
MRLRIGDDAVYYPDVQVVCDPADTEQRYTSAPCVVVEVLSPSTESIDLREKLMAYRRLKSLQAYVIIYRDQMRGLAHHRGDDGLWYDALLGQADKIRFPCPAVALPLTEIYEGIDFAVSQLPEQA